MSISRPCRRILALACAAAACGLVGSTSSRAAERVPRRPVPKPPVLRLEIEAPLPGTEVGGQDRRILVSGRALSASGRGGSFDVIAIVDTSQSTSRPSGVDVDGDGVLGDSRIGALGRLLELPSSDPGDSVLAAEIAAVRTLLRQLDPLSTRVGVVAFAGDGRDPTPDAGLAVPLAQDYGQVETALAHLLEAGSHGRTNIHAALNLAARELGDEQGAASRPRPLARKIALLVTDGQATLPHPTSRRRSGRMAVEAARRAAELGIRIDSFAVGPEAADSPWVPRDVAALTGGVFTPVRQPGDLVAAFQEVRLAEITGIEIRNLTTREPAEQVRLESDGGFAGLVALARGRNRIEICAHASDGRRILRIVDARLEHGAAPQDLSPRLLARRTRMLEARLDHTRAHTVELEAERGERLREELASRMRDERARGRELRIEGEPTTPASPARD